MKTVIIGGGVTGLSAAANLEGDKVLIEKSSSLGGYCKTTFRSGFVWDCAGHFFHFKDERMRHYFINRVLGEDFMKVRKETRIYYRGMWIHFPFQLNIHQLEKTEYTQCLIDLYDAQETKAPVASFKDYVYNSCGRSIAEKFLIPYNEKLYACDLDSLDKDAMGRFFPAVSFSQVLRQPIKGFRDSYNETFLYPRKGASQLIDVLQASAIKNNTEIKLNSCVNEIDIENSKVYFGDSAVESFDNLISTIPLNHFTSLIDQKFVPKPSSVLSQNKVIVFNIGFDSKIACDFHWMYFPGNEIFYRVGCYHNIFGDLRASFYVEVGMSADDDYDESTLLNTILKDMHSIGLIDKTMSMIDYECIEMNPAYVHINAATQAFKQKLFDIMGKKSVYSIGRYGEWKYCSIEDNMLDALRLSNYLNATHKSSELFFAENGGCSG